MVFGLVLFAKGDTSKTNGTNKRRKCGLGFFPVFPFVPFTKLSRAALTTLAIFLRYGIRVVQAASDCVVYWWNYCVQGNKKQGKHTQHAGEFCERLVTNCYIADHATGARAHDWFHPVALVRRVLRAPCRKLLYP